MTITPTPIEPHIMTEPFRHMDRVVGGKPDTAFGVEMPGAPWLAMQVVPKRQE